MFKHIPPMNPTKGGRQIQKLSPGMLYLRILDLINCPSRWSRSIQLVFNMNDPNYLELHGFIYCYCGDESHDSLIEFFFSCEIFEYEYKYKKCNFFFRF